MLDPRGTGQSAIPEDAASYRCDRLVDDVDSLREHLGLNRMDLLAHSADANLAALYVARQPERVGKVALITPSVMAVGITITEDEAARAAAWPVSRPADAVVTRARWCRPRRRTGR
jgi:proline iminopeptidase